MSADTRPESGDPLIGLEQELRRRFILDAEDANVETGYISIPSVNQTIDPEMQGVVADLIVRNYERQGIVFDRVVGIPNSGASLASVVGERLTRTGTKIALARKGKSGEEIPLPKTWKNTIRVEGVPSFTTGTFSDFVFNGLEAGQKALAIEDAIANGSTLGGIIPELNRYGVEVYPAAYFAKLFQPGVRELIGMGIDPFYAIGIERIDQNEDGIWKPVLSPAHLS